METAIPLELYLTFVAATTILIIILGPVVTLVVANSLSYGSRYALASVGGASSAVAVHLTIMALGMVSVMAVLADWFEWLRWAGGVEGIGNAEGNSQGAVLARLPGRYDQSQAVPVLRRFLPAVHRSAGSGGHAVNHFLLQLFGHLLDLR